MSLLDTRDYYKPFDNPWMFDYYSQQNQMNWFPGDITLHNDVKDWQDIADAETTGLTQRCRLFTRAAVECGSGDVER